MNYICGVPQLAQPALTLLLSVMFVCFACDTLTEATEWIGGLPCGR